MHLTRRDLIATAFVVVAVAAAALLPLGVGGHSETTVRVLTAIVLALGFAASASAVVPGFPELMHGSKPYLVVSSLLGLGALAAGIAALVDGRGAMLGLLVLATALLWGISTARHAGYWAGRSTLGGPAPAR
jgi:hypothetical protein